MGLKTITDAVRSLLTDDTTFAAELATLIGTPVANVLRANTPWEQIGERLLPCFVMEQGEGKASADATGDETGLVIGHRAQYFTSELDVVLLWNQQDRDTAADQRTQLPELLARLLLRNPQPGGANGAWLAEWIPDQGLRHPQQCWVARIRIDYAIEDTP